MDRFIIYIMIYTTLTVTLSCSAPQREGIQMLNCTCKHYNDSFLSGNLSQKERVKGCVCLWGWGVPPPSLCQSPAVIRWCLVWVMINILAYAFSSQTSRLPVLQEAKWVYMSLPALILGWRQQEGADWTLPKSTTAWHLRVWSQSFDEDLSVNHMLAPNLSCP